MKRICFTVLLLSMITLTGCFSTNPLSIARTEAVGPMPPQIDPKLPGARTNSTAKSQGSSKSIIVYPDQVTNKNALEMLENLDLEINGSMGR
ncbi:MAG: hypothetical protein AB7P49_21540 [Bdellovibrionales bacterium]